MAQERTTPYVTFSEDCLTIADTVCSLRLGSIAPNFKAETSQGPIDFHEFIGDNWVVLFSHPVSSSSSSSNSSSWLGSKTGLTQTPVERMTSRPFAQQSWAPLPSWSPSSLPVASR